MADVLSQSQIDALLKSMGSGGDEPKEEKAEKAMEEARSLIEMTEASYTHLPINASLQKALLADVTAVPTTFFVDGEGKVLGTVVGARDKESWKELIDALLAEL